MSYRITINKEDLRSEAQKELEAAAAMLDDRSGINDVFGKIENEKVVDTIIVPIRTIPIAILEGGFMVNGADLPNGWEARSAVYLGAIKAPPHS